MLALKYGSAAAVLFGIWCVLSGKMDALHLGLGGAAALATVLPLRRRRGPAFPVLGFAAYVPWFLWQVLMSNLRVARLALSRRPALDPGIVRADPGIRDERMLAVLGCSITLTPGTVTIDAGPGQLIVHALDAASARDIREGTLAKRVRRVSGDGA